MSKGQIHLLRQILGAGGDTSDLPIPQIRRNFDRLLARFPALDDVQCRPVEVPGLASGARAEWIDARLDRSSPAPRTLLYLHGGGFVIGSLDSHRQLIARLSRAADARCLGLEYRKAPEHPFPAALDDTLAAWRFLRESVEPGSLALAGDSAGGGLGVAVAVHLRDLGEPRPAALICLCPWTDYQGTSPSLDRHAALDPVVQRAGLEKMAAHYLNGRDPWDAELCPLTMDLTGLPPTLIQTGGSDALLDDAVRLHERMTEVGVHSELEIWPDMIHVWHLFAGRLDEGAQALEAAGQWLRRRLPTDPNR